MKGKGNASALFSHILLIYLLSRLALEAIGLLSLFYFPSARALFPIRDLAYHKPVKSYAEIWARWDSEWYLLVADHGYGSYEYFKDAAGGRYLPFDDAKFFPLYPFCIRLLSFVIGNSVIAGILVSNVAAVLFLYFFYMLANELFNSEQAVQAALFYIFFPASFFLNAVYSESVFLASLVAAFYFVEKKKILPACVASVLCVLGRPTGIIAAPALMWLAAVRMPERRVFYSLLIGFACMAALSAYVAMVWKVYDSFRPVVEGQNYWRGQMRYPGFALVRFLTHPIAIHGQHNSLIDFSFAMLHLCGLIVSFRKLPKPYFLYSLFCLSVPLTSTLFSFSRFCLANFPFFLYLGSQLTGRWAMLLQILFAMFLAFFMAAFANWYWVA